MADNVTLPGTGSVVAADEVGGAVYQRVKIAVGADGAAADLAPGQALSAASVPVVLASDQSDVAVTLDGEAVAVTNADLTTLAGAVDGGHLQVDVLSGASGATAVTVNVTPTCAAAAYTAGDVLFDSAEIAAAARANGTGVELVSLIARDKDDNAAAAMTLYFFNANTSLGAKEAAPDIDDTEIDTLVGMVTIPAAAWVDVGASKVANMQNVGMLMHPGAATTSLWVAASTAGTPTQTASGITLTFQFIRY